MINKKIKALDAILSLVSTAIKWINQEFPQPTAGVEDQTITEILNNLNKTNTALENLILYERGLTDSEPTTTPKALAYVGKRDENITVTWEG